MSSGQRGNDLLLVFVLADEQREARERTAGAQQQWHMQRDAVVVNLVLECLQVRLQLRI